MNGLFRAVSSALEALGSAVPSSLAALVWIGFKIGPEMIAPLLAGDVLRHR